MHAHELRERIDRAHQPATDLRQRQRAHLVVGLLLLRCQVHFPLDIELVRQVQALLLFHPKRKAVELFLQLVQTPVAHNLLESVGIELALHRHSVARLENVVTAHIQAVVREKCALLVQIHRAFGDRGACEDAPEPRATAHLFGVFAAGRARGLDGGALVHRHHCVVHKQEAPGIRRALGRAERLDVHHQNL